ncbi:hypothetical protein GCM10025867_38790 [Frondihabitans sucicola]|uniref:Type II secretion system protein GspF domain-containing protein n=1 Tax=Frondihabitans sucicola TaxID=1268041 RepID=A0ABM8GTK3_9MICO|nr:type II secretion system F family protein [Frondihabitans sucicola]BDZ51638.1 hypothetical protein GCM10025867_38790 [Frondihabitans sucicola]
MKVPFRGRRRVAAPGSSAGTLERLAVLLEAGVAPAAAWAHLAAASRDAAEEQLLRGVAEALARGEPGAPALAGALAAPETDETVARAEWQQAAAAWEVSEISGAPLAACLRSSAEAARALAQARREADVALSGPVATSKVVLALPVAGLLIGVLLGFDTLLVLVTTPLGWALVASAAGLVAAARSWNARLVARAAPPPGVPGLDLELLAVALSAGGSWGNARRLVAEALGTHCPESALDTPASEIDSLVELSQRAGVPGAALLRSAAAERRRDARAAAAMAAERLGVVLMLPLGVCVLPAFLLVGVVPLFVALLSSTGWSS